VAAVLAGNLPPVVLCDLDSLMAPVWATWLHSSGQHLMSVVDSLIAVQAPVAAASAAAGASSSGSFSTAGGSRPVSWAPVAPSQGAHYSASVVDLFVHLQVSGLYTYFFVLHRDLHAVLVRCAVKKHVLLLSTCVGSATVLGMLAFLVLSWLLLTQNFSAVPCRCL
jgi:hypothetical protein